MTWNLFNEPLETLRSWLLPMLLALPRRLWQLMKNGGDLFWLFQTSSIVHLLASAFAACIGLLALAAFIRDQVVVYREQGGLHRLFEALKRLDLLTLVGLWTLLFLLGSGLHRPRHLLLLFTFMPVALALGIARLKMRYTLGQPVVIMIVAVIVLNHIYGIVSSIPVEKPSLPLIIETLDGRGLTRGYAGYDLAYPIIFRSGERIIVSPLAGPKRVDRLPKYSNIVESSSTAFYLFPTRSRERDAFVTELIERSISFKRINLNSLTIFYEFSRRVKLAELTLLNNLPGL